MGETFELEFQKKATKIREQMSKTEVDIRHKVADIQKIKNEALKKTEEMKYSVQHDLEKIGQDIIKRKDLSEEAKAKLKSEITDLKNETEQKYLELRNIIEEKR